MTLSGCVSRLIRKHGSLRSAARAMKIDAAYLYRLAVGEKSEPTATTLRKLGIIKTVTYELRARAVRRLEIGK